MCSGSINGWEGVIRDQEGAVLAIMANKYGKGSPTKAKALTLLDTLRIAKNMDFRRIEIESDS